MKKEQKQKRRCDWHLVSVPTMKRNGEPDSVVYVGHISRARIEMWLRKNHYEEGIRKDEWVLKTNEVNLLRVGKYYHYADKNRAAVVIKQHRGSEVNTCDPLGRKVRKKRVR